MKKSIKYAVIPAIAFALLGAGVVSAKEMGTGEKNRVGGHGGGFFAFNNMDPEEFASHQSDMFANQAELTGLSIDEIKNAWAEGKKMNELLEEKGIDPETIRTKMKAQHEEKMKEQMQTLVASGVITQEQADKRIEFTKNHVPKMKGKMMHKFEQKNDAEAEVTS